MTVLERVFASSGPEVIIHTLELECSAWSESILICNGFEDQTLTDELGRTRTYIAAGIDVALPKRSNTGAQTLTFAIDNITGEAQRKLDQAIEQEAPSFVTYRVYLDVDKTAPAERPYRMRLAGGQMQGPTVQIEAGFFDVINTRWPRDLYNTNFVPGLKYV